MAHRMSTARRMDRDRDIFAKVRTVNGEFKRKATAARATRMGKLIEKGAFPYTPAIQSWVAVQLGKPFTQVTEDEVKGLLKKA